MAVILSQALVARGLLNREWIDEGAVYRDQRGNVVARFGRFEPFVDCLESLLALESHGPRTLLSSTPWTDVLVLGLAGEYLESKKTDRFWV
jgi:hypothetical protein